MATTMAKGNVKTENVSKKTFKSDDLIECRSNTSGELLVIGDKSGILYKFADYGDVESIEYQDLLYAVRRKSQNITTPRFIILDKDFVAQNKELDTIYSSIYSSKDLKDILKMSVREIKEIVPTLPDGVKDSLKGMVVNGINDGSFDSINKVRAFDELFGTNMLLMLTNN